MSGVIVPVAEGVEALLRLSQPATFTVDFVEDYDEEVVDGVIPVLRHKAVGRIQVSPDRLRWKASHFASGISADGLSRTDAVRFLWGLEVNKEV